MPPSDSFSSGIVDLLLEFVSPDVLCTLYSQEAFCFWIFKLLDELQQMVIMRMFLLDFPLEFVAIKEWFSPSSHYSKADFVASLASLKKLQILKGSSGEVWIDAKFRASLKQFFTHPESNTFCTFDMPKDTKASAFLRNSTAESAILHAKMLEILNFLVLGPEKAPLASSLVRKLLADAALFDAATGEISNLGFQFVLMDMRHQIWLLLQFFVRFVCGATEDASSVLLFLSECFSVRKYSVLRVKDNCTGHEAIVRFVHFLADLGLVKTTQDSRCLLFMLEASFFQLMNVSELLEGLSQSTQAAVVVETNYKIYVYTRSSLHRSIVGLFASVKGVFPNMFYGIFSQETLRGCFSKGISADQVLSYLRSHLHPVVGRRCNNQLPPTIVDQIKLWEMVRNRISSRKGKVFF